MTAFQKIKELLNLSGVFATVCVFILGAILGAGANLLHLIEPVPILYSILQGLISAWIATGGYDLIFKGKQ
jgi:hypothetical protein